MNALKLVRVNPVESEDIDPMLSVRLKIVDSAEVDPMENERERKILLMVAGVKRRERRIINVAVAMKAYLFVGRTLREYLMCLVEHQHLVEEQMRFNEKRNLGMDVDIYTENNVRDRKLVLAEAKGLLENLARICKA